MNLISSTEEKFKMFWKSSKIFQRLTKKTQELLKLNFQKSVCQVEEFFVRYEQKRHFDSCLWCHNARVIRIRWLAISNNEYHIHNALFIMANFLLMEKKSLTSCSNAVRSFWTSLTASRPKSTHSRLFNAD